MKLHFIFIIMTIVSQSAFSGELSLLSGFYRSISDDNNQDSTELSVGGRYGLAVIKNQQWTIQTRIIQTKSDSNADQTTITAGVGKRYLFKKLSSRLIPYLSWLASISQTSGDDSTNSGLYYSGQFGLRISLNSSFFVDLENNLFTSALTATTKDNADNKTQTTELYISSFAGFSTTIISVGYKLAN